MSGDITITHAHRTALRQIERGEAVANGDLLGRLYAAGLVDDNHLGHVWLTDEGRELLAAHDRLAETRRVERPRLESKPLPERWTAHQFEAGLALEYCGVPRIHWDRSACAAMSLGDFGPIDELLRKARDVVAALEWLAHERDVLVQDMQHERAERGVSP